MITEILKLIGVTFLPFLELRASIPYGILNPEFNLHWAWVFVVCVVANIIIGILIFLLLEWIIKILTLLPPIKRLWDRYVENTRQKIHRAVEKYGEWAVIIFIGIPLPGSGVYSGAVASFLIGLNFKKFIIADVIGVIIAGVIVTIVSLTGSELFQIFIKGL